LRPRLIQSEPGAGRPARIAVLGVLILAAATPARALDVTHYRLEISLQDDWEGLGGAARLEITLDEADAAAGLVILDFVGMEIAYVQVDLLEAAGWYREEGALTVPLPEDAAAGDEVWISVGYSGFPEPYAAPWGSWGVVRSQDRVFTVNVTEGARHWFPCNDRLDDKATAELLVTAPDPWLVAAPGELIGQEPAGEGRTRFHWSADWPLPTYLIHFAAGPYALTEETHAGIPYRFYLHPTLFGDAADTFAHAPAAMEMLTARYGDYPFPKVAFDEIDLGGAVEHPSCVSIGTQILVPEQVYEDVIAHELSHSWFQGVVTCATWDDVWLSEGMATYHEALYHEHVHGPGSISDYTESLAISYRAGAEMAEGYFPLSAPETLFGVTTYRKGALVLHTLSYLTGREIFDQLLLDYLEAYAWGNASTGDFRATAEASSGLQLGRFFDEWVHGIGYPQFGLAWRHDDRTGVVEVAVDQLQPDDWPLFLSVPLEVKIAGPDGEAQRGVMELTDRLTVAGFEVPFTPEEVVLDPDRWLLKTVEPVDFPNLPESTPEPASDAFGAEAVMDHPAMNGSGRGCSAAAAPGTCLLPLLLIFLVLFRLALRSRV